MGIRIQNTRTGRTVEARDGRDAAVMVKIEQDRRSGLTIANLGEALRPLTSTERKKVEA